MLLPSTAESLLHHNLQLPHGRAATWLLSPTVCLWSWLFQRRCRFALVFTKLHPVYFQTIPLITEISWALILSSLVSLALSWNSNKGALYSFIQIINENTGFSWTQAISLGIQLNKSFQFDSVHLVTALWVLSVISSELFPLDFLRTLLF